MSTEQNALSTISKDILVPAKLSELVRERNITTARHSIESGVPSVRAAVKNYGYKDMAAAVVMQIERLQLLLNVSKPMQPEAVAETAKMVVDYLLDDGVSINLADIDIVFSRAAKGFYGKFYGGFGCADVLGWFIDYSTEKALAYVDYNMEKSQTYNSNSPRVSDTTQAKDIIEHKRAHAQYLTSKK